MRITGKLIAAFLPFACTAAFGHSPAPSASDQPSIDAFVQESAGKVMRQHGIPGLAIAVTVHGKRRFYQYGVASKETRRKVTRDTLFEIGSVSKTFTATLAAYAQAQGMLRLGDTPGKYLPELEGSHFDQVTLINLGTHTAGGFPLQLPDHVRNTRQLMDYFKSWQPHDAPGTYRAYANPSIGLLGMVAAASMRMPFDKAMEQKLFPLLGMPDSYINVPASKMRLYAQGYDKDNAPVRVNPAVLAAEAYGVKSNARDLLRFVEKNLSLADGKRPIDRAIADTHTGYFRVGAMTQDLIWEQYGLPVRLETLLQGNGEKMAYESNAVTALMPPLPPQGSAWLNKTGSTNGFGAYIAFIPAKQLGIVILANKNYPIESRIRLAYGILDALGCCASAGD